MLADEQNGVMSTVKVLVDESDSNDEIGTANSIEQVEYNLQNAPDGW